MDDSPNRGFRFWFLLILVLLLVGAALLLLKATPSPGQLSAAEQARIRKQLNQPRPDLALSPGEQERIRAALQNR